MSKRILFFILFSWLASAAFPAFAQQKTDTVYTFRFVPHLTSSLRTPKFFVKEFSYFLMPCHQHGLRINLLVQR